MHREFLLRRALGWGRGILISAMILLAACAQSGLRRGAVPDNVLPEAALPPVLLLPGYPARMSELPTTTGAVYRNNLESLQSELARRSDADSPEILLARAGAAYEHYRAYGNLAELKNAVTMAEAAVRPVPAPRGALQLWAEIASYLHRFDAAEAVLERLATEQPGSIGAPQRALRAQMRAARGMAAHEAADLPVEFSSRDDAVAVADRCVDTGDLACASSAYHQAQFLSVDTHPVPLAWLHTQQGISLLRFGHPDVAIRFFEAALERLPGYYVAAEHLAECLTLTGQFERAEPLYVDVIAQTGNPEYMAGYAALLQAMGRDREAGYWQSEARRHYADLLALWPETYAQHAVGFYIESGDSDTALKLARKNIATRQDVGSWILLAEALAAAGERESACDALRAAVRTGWSPPELSALQVQLADCPRAGL
jgi:tetratricopeptide (TPR) repeat protein